MKRPTVLATFVLTALVALIGVFAIGPSLQDTSAQDTATQGHPLVGTWLADTDPEDSSEAPEIFLFNADGTYVHVEDGSASLGSWEATGATTANLTIVAYEADEEGTIFGSITVRASIEVSTDGTSFTAQYTLEFTDPDGASSGEAGPGTVTATRLGVEAPGTPVMTLDELFSAFEGTPEASPEATPTS